MTIEAQEPKRSEAQLKALKRQVSGIAPSMYDKPPAGAEGEAKPELEGAAEARKNQKTATPAPSKYYEDDDKKRSTKASKAKSFTRTMRHK